MSRSRNFWSILCLCLSVNLLQINQSLATEDVSMKSESIVPAAGVFFFLTANWGDKITDGDQKCPNIRCEWTQSDDMNYLAQKHKSFMSETGLSQKVTAAVYNVHSLAHKYGSRIPLNCAWRTNITLGTSEESVTRYHHLFNTTFPNFDGYSTNHPSSAVQRIHTGALLNPSDFGEKMHNFSYLIKAASYVAKDCVSGANSGRDHIVGQIRDAGFRVEGLSKCMHSTNPEGVVLFNTGFASSNLALKRAAIARFMFNMAFENSVEAGYVTEKPFDALLAGTVPVYLGDASHLKALLPHPKAAIFVADFNNNYTQLANYLTYLSNNETAYESHREWRKTFTYEGNIKKNPLLQSSWYCDVCRWAIENAAKIGSQKNDAVCLREERTQYFSTNITHFEGMTVKSSSSHDIYLVANSTLRLIPETLASLRSQVENAIFIPDAEMKKCVRGEPMTFPIRALNRKLEFNLYSDNGQMHD